MGMWYEFLQNCSNLWQHCITLPLSASSEENDVFELRAVSPGSKHHLRQPKKPDPTLISHLLSVTDVFIWAPEQGCSELGPLPRQNLALRVSVKSASMSTSTRYRLITSEVAQTRLFVVESNEMCEFLIWLNVSWTLWLDETLLTLGTWTDQNLMIVIIPLIPYQFFYSFSLGEGIKGYKHFFLHWLLHTHTLLHCVTFCNICIQLATKLQLI